MISQLCLGFLFVFALIGHTVVNAQDDFEDKFEDSEENLLTVINCKVSSVWCTIWKQLIMFGFEGW